MLPSNFNSGTQKCMCFSSSRWQQAQDYHGHNLTFDILHTSATTQHSSIKGPSWSVWTGTINWIHGRDPKSVPTQTWAWFQKQNGGSKLFCDHCQHKSDLVGDWGKNKTKRGTNTTFDWPKYQGWSQKFLRRGGHRCFTGKGGGGRVLSKGTY